MMITLSIPSSSDELDKVLDFIKLGQEVADCPIVLWMELLDTVQKIFINIVMYAFPICDGIVKINLNYIMEQNAIEVSFFNEGIQYNPLTELGFASACRGENMSEGGYISLIEKSTENHSYIYFNKKNVTTVKKYLA